MDQGGHDLPILLDPPGQIANSYRIAYVPTTVIIDSQGRVVQSKVGEVTADELESMVAPLR
jgi:hypothetical protein